MIKSVLYTEKVFPTIESFANRYPERDYTITISIPEYTSVCPMTSLPDFGTITINYIPDQLCIELKSLKYYIMEYREVGIFYENIANKIMDDIISACQPRWIEIVASFTPRGGIATTIKVDHHKSPA